MQLWHLFKCAQLNKVIREKVKLFIEFISYVCVPSILDDKEEWVPARFTHESYENYPKSFLHMYENNEPVVKRNEVVVNDLLPDDYKKNADDKSKDHGK